MSRSNSGFALQVKQEVPEEFVTLRINIEFASAGQDLKTVAVTSSKRGEGRSTSARQLAIALAQAGKSTVLVHADLRVPTNYGSFGREAGQGLSGYLLNQLQWNQVLELTAVEGLHIIKAGPATSNASQLLSSSRMEELLQQLKQTYDVVVIDGPPLSFIDGKVLAAKCDGVILVIEYGKVSRATAKRMHEELSHIRAKLLGTVLNKCKESNMHRY